MKTFYTPEELKALSPAQAKEYCGKLREFLVRSVFTTGGHLASNLGIVEISTALVRVLDPKREHVIYDTGHQCYVHKILTGRGGDFATLRQLGGISGFPRREESSFDAFGTGHSGTGISAALGFASAKRLRKDPSYTVAVIGDGAFTGGMVFEALNNLSSNDRLIVILNDNGMSISRSVGKIKSALNRMRTADYYRWKDSVRDALEAVPVAGKYLQKGARMLKNSVKRSALPMGNLFEQFGLHYFGPADGNDLETVEFLLSEAKKRNGPSLIHLCTKKGKGYAPAEADPSSFHAVSPRARAKKAGDSSENRTFSQIFGQCVTELAQKDPKIVCITAAMTDGVGLSTFAKRFPHRFFDVGIAEEHAMTFCSALAAQSLKPCFAVYSTFYQRAVEQLLHDAALQKLPAVLALDRAGITGEDGSTHHGLFDLPFLLPMPGIRIYAPVGEKEMYRFLKQSFAEKERTSVLRYAKASPDPEVLSVFPQEAEVEWADFGPSVPPQVIAVCFGRLTCEALAACRRVAEHNVSVRLVRFAVLKGFDESCLDGLFSGQSAVLFTEEGMEIGGFSHYLSALLEKRGLLAGRKTSYLAVGDTFMPHGKTSELLALAGLDRNHIEKELMHLAET